MKILRSPDVPEPTGAPAVSSQVPTAPEPEPAPGPVAAAPPPAARVVLEGGRTEREIELEAELAAERARTAEAAEGRRKAEADAAYAQDEARRLREIQSGPAPAARPARSAWRPIIKL